MIWISVSYTHLFDDMEGTINRLIRYENSLIIGYMTSSEEKSGTYCFDIEKGTMEKYSDICGSAFENNISGFIWKDYYCLPTFNTVYLISLSGKENKEIDMGGLCTDMYLDGDCLLYTSSVRIGEIFGNVF